MHEHEMIWIQAADGSWRLVRALLDPGLPAGLIVPSVLVHELGYGKKASRPFAV